jgi:hypothetical protein
MRGALLALFGLLLLAPLMLSPLPMLGDFPNHAARLWLLGGGMEQMPTVYGADWSRAFTNIGGDLMARLLAGWVSGDRVTQGILAFAIIGPPLGCLLLNQRLHGWNVWQFIFPTLAWTLTLIYGFITFQMGLALAMMLVAADTVVRPGPGRWLLRVAGAFFMLVVHPFALLFYAALLGGLVLGPRLMDRFRSRQAFTGLLGSGAMLVVCCLLPIAVLALTASHLPGEDAHSEGSQIIWMEGLVPVAALLSPLRTYSRWGDLIFWALVALVPAYALLRRHIHVHQGMFTVALILAIASLFMPKAIAGTVLMEVRLPIMAVLALAASLRISPPGRQAAAFAAVALGLLSVVRTADVARHWSRGAEDVAAVRRALAVVPPHSYVLPLQHEATREAALNAPLGRYFSDTSRAFDHVLAYSVIWRQDFIPNLFSARGKQPLLVLPPNDEIAVPEGLMASVHALSDPDYELSPSQHYVRHWRDRFDYALVVNADLPDQRGPVTLPAGVEMVADEGFVQVLRLPRSRRPDLITQSTRP